MFLQKSGPIAISSYTSIFFTLLTIKQGAAIHMPATRLAITTLATSSLLSPSSREMTIQKKYSSHNSLHIKPSDREDALLRLRSAPRRAAVTWQQSRNVQGDTALDASVGVTELRLLLLIAAFGRAFIMSAEVFGGLLRQAVRVTGWYGVQCSGHCWLAWRRPDTFALASHLRTCPCVE